MNPAFDELEAELAAMRPRPLSPALLEGIEGGMAESSAPSSARSSRWPDRFLLCADPAAAVQPIVPITPARVGDAGIGAAAGGGLFARRRPRRFGVGR